jgi:hypothetical protein
MFFSSFAVLVWIFFYISFLHFLLLNISQILVHELVGMIELFPLPMLR